MLRTELNRYIGAIIEALDEAKGQPVGESIIYLGIGMNFGLWQDLRQVLVDGGVIEISGEYGVNLTPKGQDLAGQIKAARAA